MHPSVFIDRYAWLIQSNKFDLSGTFCNKDPIGDLEPYSGLSQTFMMERFFKIVNSAAGIYLLKNNNRNTRTRCEISSKLTIKTPERRD